VNMLGCEGSRVGGWRAAAVVRLLVSSMPDVQLGVV
jgi:hypothetical protein